MKTRSKSHISRWNDVPFFVGWFCIIVLTCLSSITTQRGFATVLPANEANFFILSWLLSGAVMSLQLLALVAFKKSKSLPHRILIAAALALTFTTSVGSGRSAYDDWRNGGARALAGFQAGCTGLERSIAECETAVDLLVQNLSDLAADNMKKAAIERDEGGTFAGSLPGPGPLMRLREARAQTSARLVQQVSSIGDSLRAERSRLAILRTEFDPKRPRFMENRLVQRAIRVNAYLDHPVFDGLESNLKAEIAIGQKGLRDEGRILDAYDAGFESSALICLQAIERIPTDVTVPHIYSTGGDESLELVFDETANYLASLFRLRPASPAQINAERRDALQSMNRGNAEEAGSQYRLHPLSLFAACLTDILLAIGVYVVPSRPDRRRFTLPPVSDLVGTIRSALEGGQLAWAAGVNDFDLLRAFVGSYVSEALHSVVFRDTDGRLHIVATKGASTPEIRAAQRYGYLLVLCGRATEVVVKADHSVFDRIWATVDRMRGRKTELESNIVVDMSDAAFWTSMRLLDQDFRDRLLECEYSEPSGDNLKALEAEA